MMQSDVPTEGERIILRYQSVNNPDADKTEVTGVVTRVTDNEFYVETTEANRELAVWRDGTKYDVHSVRDLGDNDRTTGRKTGEKAEWETGGDA